MKKVTKIISTLICAVILLCAMTSITYADQKNGWVEENGVSKYYENGAYVTGVKTINGMMYEFDSQGVYLGVYDGHKAIGEHGTMDTEEYRSALENVDTVLFCDFKEGSDSSLGALSNGLSATKSVNVPNAKKPYVALVIKNGQASFSDKEGAQDGNLYAQFKTATKFYDGVTAYDSYIDINVPTIEGSYVYEAEYKLTEDFAPNGTMNFLQIINRSIAQSTVFCRILSLNSEGGIIGTSNNGVIYGLLTDKEFTRVSVAIHPAKNEFDIYINGVLVERGITFYSGDDVSPADFSTEQLRTCQFPSRYVDQGGVCVDNISVYKAEKPICTDDDAKQKNGVYEEGGHIRYYINNKIFTGVKEISGEFFGVHYDGEPVVFDKYTGAATVGAKAEVIVDGVVTDSFLIQNNQLIAPDAVDLKNKAFVGWKVTENQAGTYFLSAGESRFVNSFVKLEAIGVEFDMLDGASVSINSGEAALRYIAKINKADMDALRELGIEIEARMLIAPKEDIDKTHGYNDKYSLDLLGLKNYVDVKSESWYTETENYYYYAGVLSGIKEQDYLKQYSGVAYLSVKCNDGGTLNLYSDYSEEDNCRSVHYVAQSAYNDRITVKGYDGYKNKEKFKKIDTFSPYNKDQLNVIKGYVDKVVAIESGENGITGAGMFYEPPYKISAEENDKGYQVTLTGVKSPLGVIVNGKRLSEGEYTVTGEVCDLSVEGGKVTLSPNNEEIEISEWWMLDAVSGKSAFGKAVNFPTDAPDGTSKGALWKYTTSSVILSDGSLEEYEKNFGYYDMSDWEAIEFYIYIDEAYVGSTFVFYFESENPEVDGMDYFTTTVKLSNGGWNRIILNRSDMSANRSPLGWDRITSVVMTSTGWSQNNDKDAELYFTSIKAYDAPMKLTEGFSDEIFSKTSMFVIGGYQSIIKGEFVCANPEDYSAVSFTENGINYIPVNAFAGYFDEDAAYYSGINKVFFEYSGSDYIFFEGDYYQKDSERIKLINPAKLNGEAVFISVEDAMAIFDYNQKYIDRMGFIALWKSDDPTPIFDETADFDKIYTVMQTCIFQRPTGEQVAQDLIEYSGGTHPYLMLTDEDFEKLGFYKQMDQTLAGYIKKLMSTHGIGSSKFNSAPQYFRLTDGRRLLSISRDVMDKVMAWSILYKLGDYNEQEKAQVLERIWKELDAVTNFYDEANKKYSWHPEHFLDTAEMAYPVAIAYDWMYDVWTAEQKQQIEKALYDLALKQTTILGGMYNLGGSTNNWNGVCNGGILTAALAIVNVEEYRADAIKVIENSIVSAEKGMWVYAPDGGYEEGPGYWGYGTTYMHIYMSCLDSACGTNYGYYNSPGFARSAYFTTYMGNANTTWGFHDGGSGDSSPEIAAWFAMKSGDGNLNAIRRNSLDNGWTGLSRYDIMYFDPHIVNKTISLNLDSYYSLDTIMTFRSSWDTKNNIFTGLHGGDNAASHGDLDIGNFVINVNGVYMICDLGSENYNTYGYFAGHRWSYYRKRAEGQNTVVMLPSGDSWNGTTGAPETIIGNKVVSNGALPVPDQNAGAVSKALRYESGVNSAIGVVDMRPAYNKDHVTSFIRGLWMKDDRKTIIIQDEGEFKRSMDLWWFAHTEGKITLSEDGKSAFITRGGITLYAELVTDIASAEFSVMKAESLDKNYVGDYVDSGIYGSETEKSRDAYSKLCVKATNVTEYKLAVVFKVIDSAEVAPQFGTSYQWTDIKDWTVN